MPALVKSMFYVRGTPWHGLGINVQEAPSSQDALICAGLNWDVIQEKSYSEDGMLISGYKVNIGSSDGTHLGIMSDRYKVVQNRDAFSFTDELLSEGTPLIDRAFMLVKSA